MLAMDSRTSTLLRIDDSTLADWCHVSGRCCAASCLILLLQLKNFCPGLAQSLLNIKRIYTFTLYF